MRKILGVFEVFLGIFEKTKEKKDREDQKRPSVHKIVLSIKWRFPPPSPEKSVNLGGSYKKGVGVDGVGVIFPFFMHFPPFFAHFPPFSSLFSSSPKGQGQTTAIDCKNREFHCDPVCTDPVQNFPINFEDFLLICTVFPQFALFFSGGGGETKFCGQEFYGHPDFLKRTKCISNGARFHATTTSRSRVSRRVMTLFGAKRREEMLSHLPIGTDESVASPLGAIAEDREVNH